MKSLQWPRLAIISAFVVPLYFAVCTNHLWEDFFITFRVSQNLVAGRGMVFQAGERVHTFTSPLGMLVPALCSWVSGGHHDEIAIWAFRIVCCGFLAATMLLVFRILRRLGVGMAGSVAAASLLVFDAKISDFAINGMETAMVLFFFAVTLFALLEPHHRVLRLTIGLAGLLWSRPDGFVFAGVLLCGYAVFVWRKMDAMERRSTLLDCGRGILLGGLCYVPWFVYAWAFFGSPVPNTIIAKSVVLSPGWMGSLKFPLFLVTGKAWLTTIFLPSYYHFGGWPKVLAVVSYALTLPASLCFLWPRAGAQVRGMSLALFLGGAYLQGIPQFPWYYPWWQMLAVVVNAAAISELLRAVDVRETAKRLLLPVIRVLAGVVILVQVSVWVGTAVQMQHNQAEIEDGVRRPIGQWLHDHARRTDTVMLEPLGYIGYYSGLKMLDSPGLSAPEMTEAIRAGAKTWPELVKRFNPDWLVMRPNEIRDVLSAGQERFNAEYKLMGAIDARARVMAHSFYPGREYALYDSVFLVYHRIVPATPNPAAPPADS